MNTHCRGSDSRKGQEEGWAGEESQVEEVSRCYSFVLKKFVFWLDSLNV